MKFEILVTTNFRILKIAIALIKYEADILGPYCVVEESQNNNDDFVLLSTSSTYDGGLLDFINRQAIIMNTFKRKP